LLLRDLGNIANNQRFLLLLNVEPLLVPISCGGAKWHIRVCNLHSITEKKIGPSGNLGSAHSLLLLETEKVPPQIEVGLDAKICLTEGDEDGNNRNGVGVEIADTNPIIIIELAQERVAGISKSTPIEIFENYNFARMEIWIALTN
jgi:hypothetical protein